jgi:hypothetical protein
MADVDDVALEAGTALGASDAIQVAKALHGHLEVGTAEPQVSLHRRMAGVARELMARRRLASPRHGEKHRWSRPNGGGRRPWGAPAANGSPRCIETDARPVIGPRSELSGPSAL